ncbi:alkane 1-monooxygenase [Spongiimicrobium sp. 3-5]|uniref:alkane 1-monooxygenase n=1 Tax=Spongiimicrobium sp. 3-5 TaxID=3332596 RepID=UPI00397F2B4A
MKDLKYLAAMSIPYAAIVSIHDKGLMSFVTVFFAFVVIPILELLLPQDISNYKGDIRERKKNSLIYDLFLYLNIPVVFCIVFYALWKTTKDIYATYELIGVILSVGFVLAVNGINVAHELGHRQASPQRYLGKLLLLPSLYMHFYIEHNFGHHARAATKEDPATAKYNQSVYSYWVTSVPKQYLSAWKLQLKMLRPKQLSFFSLQNDMFWFSVLQTSYLVLITFFFGWLGLLLALAFAIVGILLLETVNYIEHYGLRRKKLPSGRYERVKEIHSWNSNHLIGRAILFELTRHSDHHFKSSKKYQILDYHDSSPQMPFGYPTSMVLSLVPPLWFWIMNKRIPEEMRANVKN